MSNPYFYRVLERLNDGGVKPVMTLEGPKWLQFDIKMRKLLPKGLYRFLIKIKRAIFGPHGLADPK